MDQTKRIEALEKRVTELEEKVAAATTTQDVKAIIKLNEKEISESIVKNLSLEARRRRAE